jgi:hypothetical protein
MAGVQIRKLGDGGQIGEQAPQPWWLSRNGACRGIWEMSLLGIILMMI